MRTLTSILGITAALLTVLATALTPFWLMGAFTRALASTGVHGNPAYVGSPVARTLLRDGYEIQIHEPVRAQAPCEQVTPFLQVDWNPAGNLPAQVEEGLDLGGDGRVDLRVRFQVPADPKAPLTADVTCTSGRVRSLQGIRKQSLSMLCVRTGDRIILRVPLAPGGSWTQGPVEDSGSPRSGPLSIMGPLSEVRRAPTDANGDQAQADQSMRDDVGRSASGDREVGKRYQTE